MNRPSKVQTPFPMWHACIRDCDGAYGLKVRYYDKNRRVWGFSVGLLLRRRFAEFRFDIALGAPEAGQAFIFFRIGRQGR